MEVAGATSPERVHSAACNGRYLLLFWWLERWCSLKDICRNGSYFVQDVAPLLEPPQALENGRGRPITLYLVNQISLLEQIKMGLLEHQFLEKVRGRVRVLRFE